MIPKIIHYCWFGRNSKPKLAEKCIRSWKRYCPNYSIIEWNEDNFDISSAPLYVRQAYDAKKWAFVTDYVRLKVVYDHGGIYMDTDVELVRPLTELQGYSAYFGFENGPYVNTGLGFGAEKNASVLSDMMKDYDTIPFITKDGEFDLLPCPVRNTEVLLRYGLTPDGATQTLKDNIRILSSEWLCPYKDWDGEKQLTKNTISIHWFSASWESSEYHKKKLAAVSRNTKIRRKGKIKEFLYNIRYLPNKLLLAVLGEKRYSSLKNRINGGSRNDS